MKTLIGMVAFVLEQYKLFIQDKITSEQFRNNVWEYANFLSRQPQLSDFVACGKDGLPLKMPIIYDGMDSDALLDEKKYLQALDKVLFKGFEIKEISENYKIIINKKLDCIVFSSQFKQSFFLHSDYTTLESLTSYNLELTDNAKNIIDGNV